MTRLGFLAEDWAADLLRDLGYSVVQNPLVGGVQVDLIVERDGLQSPVEVIFRSSLVPLSSIREKVLRFLPLIDSGNYVSPLVLVLGKTTQQAKEFASTMFGTRVWDLEVLRQRAKPFPRLLDRLEQLLTEKHESRSKNQSDQNDVPEERQNTANERKTETENLTERLRLHKEQGELTPREYEELCQETVTFLFDPDLYGFEKQAQTSDGGNRYDFICRIRPGNPFWDSIRADFRTRSVLFECKNYSAAISADQVYSTERYLFSGALRTVCFLISRHGPDDGCKRAAQGALREAGKLILLLSNDDLIEMLRLKEDKEGPTSFLDERIWQFIITLPR